MSYRAHLVFVVAVCIAFFASRVYAVVLPERVAARDGSEMVLVPAGAFLMGSPKEEGQKIEHPQHEVRLDGFYIDTTEVSNEQYAAFLNEIRAPEGKEGEIWGWVVLRSDLQYPERARWWPSEVFFSKGKYKVTPGFEKNPIITISWHGARTYCEYYGKRLPTEAEWEKAARGGLEGKRFPWGDEYPTAGATFNRVWRNNEEPAPTTPVASYAPNGYGIYDMAGNVWEWCEDGFDPGYYARSKNKNPRGGNDKFRKVLRGGSWFNPPGFIRVAQRNFGHAEGLMDAIGFRCAMDATPEALENAGVVRKDGTTPSVSADKESKVDQPAPAQTPR